MEEDIKFDLEGGEPGAVSAALTRSDKLRFQRELRGLELKAYSGVLEALRASGKPNSEKETVIKTLKDFFHVSEDRHKAELRVLAYDERLSLICRQLSGYHFTEEWAGEAQRVYVPLRNQSYSLYHAHPSTSANITSPHKTRVLRKVILDDAPDVESDEDVNSDVEEEMELIDRVFKKYRICNGWQAEETKPLTIAVEPGAGNEKEFEELELNMKRKLKSRSKKPSPAKSPDITEAPKTPTKPNNVVNEKSDSAVRGRGVKRKNSEESESPLEKSSTFTSKKLSIKPRNVLKVKKAKKSQPPPPKVKIPIPIPLEELESEEIKAKESSEETTSADEGENGPLPLEESSRVMSPVFSEVIRSSFIARGRGRGLRGRVGIERKRNNLVTSPSKIKTGKHRARTPSQKSGKTKGSNSTTGSRRKSKLNEKIDYDEVLMDLDNNEVEKQQLSPYTTINDDISKRFLENQEHERINDARTAFKDYRSSEECVVTYTETLPINFNPDDMEQVNDGVFKRPLPPSRGPKHWEILDARLTQEERIADENVSKQHDANLGEGYLTHHQHPETSMMANHINDMTNPSTPKSPEQNQAHKKQRIKSPLIVNPNINPPNVSKVPLPAPVFSTSLNAVNKKRSKPISVVDSLNLHLPTSATASSLAASSNNRRPGTSTGCSMFSNSSALIAGARGTAPGILQQQRKAQPHILANSKVHQRTFLPAVNSSICSSVNTNILPVPGSPVSLACPPNTVAANPVASAQAVQISNSPIPISAISSVTPTAIPFQSYPTSNSPNLNINAPGVPIGHVNRSAAGTNIIFVQKANGPTVASSTTVPNNVYPLKTPPRAVILRRTQIPRQGNVMILDVQKNQLVGTGQVPPFLQTARILNAPGELSLLNLQQQPNASPRKSSPSPAPIIVSQSSSSSVQNVLPPAHFQKSNETINPVNQESFVVTVSESASVPPQTSVLNAVDDATVFQQDQLSEKTSSSDGVSESSTQAQEASQDAQYAQIEAELMQMEEGNFEDVVYEEEVTTEVIPLEDGVTGGDEQYIYENNACANADGEGLNQETHNASSVSGSSTDTASENETSIHSFESPDHDGNRLNSIKTVSLSPMGEAKIASEAISRAISLSKSSSPAKRLTFTTPITSGTTTFSIGKSITCSMANESIMSNLPIIYQASTTTMKSPAIVIEDSATSFQLGKSQVPIEMEVTMHNNDVHDHAHLQENVNTG
ncbi:Protein EMSY [Orchesella cincta]|uniref:Protein EMSY n=1 Tax=Orchesella cincta TaxID=48709 RepID=A0A1D2MP26_ORCCI|nr:Protein EMSY [Orchesella cincta]